MARVGQVERNVHALVAIDLVQRVAQTFQHRVQVHLMTYQTALAQTGALQLVTDLLAHALDLGLQHPGLIAILGTLGHVFTDALQHRQGRFQAMSQVVEGITIATALLTLTMQQTVEGTGQAQQFPGMFLTEAFAGATFDLVQFLAQAPQCLQTPSQADPQQRQQHQQSRTKTQIEVFPQALEG
ncbi:hypothetical protein D3C73_981110 [compost metagenome]